MAFPTVVGTAARATCASLALLFEVQRPPVTVLVASALGQGGFVRKFRQRDVRQFRGFGGRARRRDGHSSMFLSLIASGTIYTTTSDRRGDGRRLLSRAQRAYPGYDVGDSAGDRRRRVEPRSWVAVYELV